MPVPIPPERAIFCVRFCAAKWHTRVFTEGSWHRSIGKHESGEIREGFESPSLRQFRFGQRASWMS